MVSVNHYSNGNGNGHGGGGYGLDDEPEGEQGGYLLQPAPLPPGYQHLELPVDDDLDVRVDGFEGVVGEEKVAGVFVGDPNDGEIDYDHEPLRAPTPEPLPWRTETAVMTPAPLPPTPITPPPPPMESLSPAPLPAPPPPTTSVVPAASITPAPKPKTRGDDLPWEGFRVAASDQHGQSTRMFVRVQPAHARQIGNIIATRLWPYRDAGDLMRHAIDIHLHLLESLHPIPSVTRQVDTILEVLREDEFNADFRTVFEKLQNQVAVYVGMGSVEEARSLVRRVRVYVDDMPEGPWKTRYLKELDVKFAHLNPDRPGSGQMYDGTARYVDSADGIPRDPSRD